MKFKDEIIKHIKSRTDIEEPKIDIHKFLESYEMGIYGQMCCDRIAEAELLDEKHIVIDLAYPGHICVDKIGFLKCEDIFLSYVPQETVDEILDAFFTLSEATAAGNGLIHSLRNMSKKDIRESLEELNKNTDDEEKMPHMKEYLKQELKCKGAVHGARIYLINKLKDLYIRFRYRKVYSVLKKCCENIEDTTAENIRKPAAVKGKNQWIVYLEALERFMEKYENKIIPENLQRDELKKYVFLGVKYIGKSRYSHNKNMNAEQEYKKIESIMAAIKLMTPRELTQMFPIAKEYDGDKYESKDYFYTMDAIENIGIDSALGTHENVINLLWDYTNHDISMFMVRWMGVVGDLAVYTQNRDPLEQFFSIRNEKYGNAEI